MKSLKTLRKTLLSSYTLSNITVKALVALTFLRYTTLLNDLKTLINGNFSISETR